MSGEDSMEVIAVLHPARWVSGKGGFDPGGLGLNDRTQVLLAKEIDSAQKTFRGDGIV